MSAEKRLFWPFLLSSVILISVVITLQLGWVRARSALATFFSARLWFNRSSIQDLSWLIFNSLIRIWVLIPLLGSHLAAAMAFSLFLQQTLGDSAFTEFSRAGALNAAILLILFSLSFFVVEDLSRFSLHRLMHAVPFLWKLHSVHHSATTMTPLTLHRVHTVEMGFYQIRGLIVFAVMAGGYTYLFQSPANVWQILGVDALGFVFNALGANLRHSHVWLSFGRLEQWLISPAQHQIHHSSAEADKDLNFGTCLAIWDRLSGSYRRATIAPQRVSFGLTKKKVNETDYQAARI